MNEQSVQERYAPENICFGCGPANPKGLRIRSFQEGDTLVAETVGFNEHVQIARGVPHGDKMKIVERFRLTDPDTMTIETTITDPGVLAAPYTTAATLRRHRNWTVSEYICEENNRNYTDQSGKAGINLTVPGTKKD